MPKKAHITAILVRESMEADARQLTGEILRESTIPWVAKIERVVLDNQDEPRRVRLLEKNPRKRNKTLPHTDPIAERS